MIFGHIHLECDEATLKLRSLVPLNERTRLVTVSSEVEVWVLAKHLCKVSADSLGLSDLETAITN